MSTIELSRVYAGYIDCLNKQNWPALSKFVHEDVQHNGRPFGLSGYRGMLENDFRQIPDLCFNILLLVADSSTVACRLGFDCSPSGTFLGLPVNGKQVRFTENVFYQFRDGKIEQVWSVIDKAAIEAQL
ncbi:MAG TPA: ester cyclase [Pseudomonas sp.]